MLILVVLLLVLLLAGGGYGWRRYNGAGWNDPVGLIVLILLVLFVVWLIGGPTWYPRGYYPY